MALVTGTWLPWVSPFWYAEKIWYWWNVKRKHNQTMNKIKIAIVILASSFSAFAATPPVDPPKELNFRKGVSLETFAAATAADLNGDVDFGAGLGLNYFFTRGFGIGGRVTAWDNDYSVVDETSARVIARAPLWDRVSPFGYAEGFYNSTHTRYEDGTFGAGSGAGLELAVSRNISFKAEAGLRVLTNGKAAAIGTAGLSYNF